MLQFNSRGQLSKLRRSLAGVLVASAIATTVAVGASAVTPQPVAAAASAVKACFVYASNGSAAVNQPIYLQRWYSSAWHAVTSGNTGSTGCGTFGGQWTVAGAYYRIVLSKKVGTLCQPSGAGMWMEYGESPWGTAPSSGTLFLGSSPVNTWSC